VLDEAVVAELAPAAEPPERPPPEMPGPPPPPDGKLVADGEGEGNGVFVFVGDGVGVGVGVTVAVGEGEGLPESPEPVGSPSVAWRARAEPRLVYEAYTVMAVPLAWLDAGTSAEASEVDESMLDVVADGELVEDEFDEEFDESLAAPPPMAIDVVPLAELRAKSAETVCEIVPLVTFAVR
jgi:hypothetical protein